MTNYVLPKLHYATNALEPHYSAEALEIHHQKHHAGYVKKLNKVVSDLSTARDNNEYRWIAQLQSELAFNLAGHNLHSLFWLSMDPKNGGKIPATTKDLMKKNFGSVNACKKQFKAAAASIQGSGWVAITHEPETDRVLIEQIHDHQNNQTSRTRPLLVLDMWEHAFYLQYKNEKKKWIDAFLEIANWQAVDATLGKPEKL